GLIPVLEPVLHQPDLGRLPQRDSPAENLERLARAVRWCPPSHLHRLRVVADHPGHELDVSRGIRAANAVDPGLLDARERGLAAGTALGERDREQDDDRACGHPGDSLEHTYL